MPNANSSLWDLLSDLQSAHDALAGGRAARGDTAALEMAKATAYQQVLGALETLYYPAGGGPPPPPPPPPP